MHPRSPCRQFLSKYGRTVARIVRISDGAWYFISGREPQRVVHTGIKAFDGVREFHDFGCHRAQCNKIPVRCGLCDGMRRLSTKPPAIKCVLKAPNTAASDFASIPRVINNIRAKDSAIRYKASSTTVIRWCSRIPTALWICLRSTVNHVEESGRAFPQPLSDQGKRFRRAQSKK
jgi:hypothetical protein